MFVRAASTAGGPSRCRSRSNQIRFRPGQTQLWGLQLGRHIRSKNERTYLTPVPISGGAGEFWVSADSTLTGIEVPAGNRTLEIKPYAIGSLATDLNAVSCILNEGDGDFGLDVKYGVTQNLTADFTYNTDFAQVEVDEQQAASYQGVFTYNGDLYAFQVETRIAQARFSTEFENSDRIGFDVQDNYEFLVQPFPIASDVTIPVGAYAFQDLFASYPMGTQRRFSGTFSIQRGGFFSGNITAYAYRRGRIEVTPQFSFEPSISINRIELPEGSFTATLVQSRVTYTLTPRMFFSGLVQYNSASNSFSTNLRLRWEYQPGSELFVVYNDQRDTSLRGTPFLENRAFVIKLTRLFRF